MINLWKWWTRSSPDGDADFSFIVEWNNHTHFGNFGQVKPRGAAWQERIRHHRLGQSPVPQQDSLKAHLYFEHKKLYSGIPEF